MCQMSREKALIKKTAIYAIGNLGSKILAYIMVLIYSYYISTDDMGYYDLILATGEMIRPLVLFQINDGVYRFLVGAKREQKSAVIGTGFRFVLLSTACSELLFILIASQLHFRYSVWIGVHFATTILYLFLQDTVRGLGDSKLYATCGVLNSLVMLIFEVIGLIVLRMGVVSLIISKAIANIVCIIVFLVKHPNCLERVCEKSDTRIRRELLRYSAPLVPNTICWWVVNSSDRYIILYFLGAAYNGIFSMAYKFPTILTTVTGIFFLAWQESAIKEYDSPNRDEFFSGIFKKYYRLLFTLSLCAIPATHIVIQLFVSQQYKSAWIYTGFLFLGASFSALCSFLGMGYQISKQTNRSLMTTVFSAFVNIVVNIALIRFIGLQAASFSTFVAYLFLFVVRVFHTKRYFKLEVCWLEFTMLTIACLGYLLIVIGIKSLIISFILTILALGLTIALNKELIKPILGKIHIIKGA